jgi:hypothetical protein
MPTRFSAFRNDALSAASQTDPSAVSPSPIKTYVR